MRSSQRTCPFMTANDSPNAVVNGTASGQDMRKASLKELKTTNSFISLYLRPVDPTKQSLERRAPLRKSWVQPWATIFGRRNTCTSVIVLI